MNDVILQGFIRDIQFSHDIGNIEYCKANLICPNNQERDDDIVSLRFKKFSNKYQEGDFVELKGNIRSYSQKNEFHNTVEIYVFTYFDAPSMFKKNAVAIDGNICKMGTLGISKFGKKYIHFTLANNIFTPGGKKLNNYIPCTAYEDLAELIEREYSVKDHISLDGEIHSHTYKKKVEDEFEYKIAHEVVITNIGDK